MRSLRYCMSEPFETVRRYYLEGIIDLTDWELYLFYWRNSAPRFSDLAQAYELKQ